MSVIFSMREDSIGVHEEGTFDPDWMDTIDKLRDRYAFVADCCTYGCFPKATQPKGPKVYVDHDAVLSAAECQDRFGYEVNPDDLSAVRKLGLQWAFQNDAFIIQQTSLFELNAQQEIWRHCYGPDISFPLEKVRRLLTLNIQRHKPELVFTIENGQRLAKQLF
jgi:hypothetical protein